MWGCGGTSQAQVPSSIEGKRFYKCYPLSFRLAHQHVSHYLCYSSAAPPHASVLCHAVTHNPQFPCLFQYLPHCVYDTSPCLWWSISAQHYSYVLYTRARVHTHTHTRRGHANTQQPPCGWHDEALGVDVTTARQARNNVMKSSVMWLGAFHNKNRLKNNTQKK